MSKHEAMARAVQWGEAHCSLLLSQLVIPPSSGDGSQVPWSQRCRTSWSSQWYKWRTTSHSCLSPCWWSWRWIPYGWKLESRGSENWDTSWLCLLQPQSCPMSWGQSIQFPGLRPIGFLSSETVMELCSPGPEVAHSLQHPCSLEGLSSDRSLVSKVSSAVEASGFVFLGAGCATTRVDPASAASPGTWAWVRARGRPASPASSDLDVRTYRERCPDPTVPPIPVLAVSTVREEGSTARQSSQRTVRGVPASWRPRPSTCGRGTIRVSSLQGRLVEGMTRWIIMRHYPHIVWYLLVGWICSDDCPLTYPHYSISIHLCLDRYVILSLSTLYCLSLYTWIDTLSCPYLLSLSYRRWCQDQDGMTGGGNQDDEW